MVQLHPAEPAFLGEDAPPTPDGARGAGAYAVRPGVIQQSTDYVRVLLAFCRFDIFFTSISGPCTTKMMHFTNNNDVFPPPVILGS